MPTICDLASGRKFLLAPGTVFTVGRNPQADLPVRDGSCSRRQFSIEVDDHSACLLRPLSNVCPTQCEGITVFEPIRLDQDVEITAGQSRFQFSLDADLLEESPQNLPADRPTPTLEGEPSMRPEATECQLAPAPGMLETVIGSYPDSTEWPTIAPVRIDSSAIIGRDPQQASVVLPHVQVSRIHARLVPHREGAILEDLQSSAGTYVNGERWLAPGRIAEGDVVGIGPYQLVYARGILRTLPRRGNQQLVARELNKAVGIHGQQTPKILLNDVSLAIAPKQFVCILGPAGCGKSTLLLALSGRQRAHSGCVMLNGRNLYAEYDQLKHALAYVPQRDLLHSKLTVEESLHFTARLRLPEDTDGRELASIVEATIAKVGLVEQRQTRIEHLSGGQTKRASLATEILANPSVIFLDEVTSGLDQHSDQQAMELFRSLADSGKTVICVTHNLAHIEPACHLVIVLAEGGSLAFVGSPRRAREHFQVDRIGQIYERLGQQSPEQWRRAFRDCPEHAQYVAPAQASPAPSAAQPVPQPDRTRRVTLRAALHQLPVLLTRYSRLLLADRGALAATVGQCFLVAALIILVFGDLAGSAANDPAGNPVHQATHSSNSLFLAAISCFWFGCNNASKELVKERSIFLKEYYAGLKIGAYLCSKMLPLGLLSCVQALAMFAAVSHFCSLPGDFLPAAAVLGLVAVVGVSCGLAISAVARSEEMATALVPIALIPQIILSGGIKPLSGMSEWLAQSVISTYWSLGMLRSTLPDHLQSVLLTPPTETEISTAMLVAHAAFFVLVTIVSLRRTTVRNH